MGLKNGAPEDETTAIDLEEVAGCINEINVLLEEANIDATTARHVLALCLMDVVGATDERLTTPRELRDESISLLKEVEELYELLPFDEDTEEPEASDVQA